jgi:hypothetical protein
VTFEYTRSKLSSDGETCTVVLCDDAGDSHEVLCVLDSDDRVVIAGHATLASDFVLADDFCASMAAQRILWHAGAARDAWRRTGEVV